MSSSLDSILIRNCESLDELGACVQMQSEVWGFTAEDVVPRRAFVVARHIGGQVIGAFDLSSAGGKGSAGCLVGFAMALPGVSEGQPYLHSHMLAVRAGYRNRGIGRKLKLFQRQEALERGIRCMEWTFDPLEIKNSFLNIVKLGVLVRRYSPNLYGVSSSSLQGSLPTDRLHAEWWMDSARVKALLQGQAFPNPRAVSTIVVPRETGGWRYDPAGQERILRVQEENRLRFEKAFAEGLAVFGFSIDSDGNGVFQLGEWAQPLPASSAALGT